MTKIVYSEYSKNIPHSLALLGPYPHPPGGVSIHIQRLMERLSQDGLSVTLYSQPNISTKNDLNIIPCRRYFKWHFWLFEHSWRCRADIIHNHDGWYWGPALLLMSLRGKKIISTIHDQMVLEKWNNSRLFAKIANRILIKKNSLWCIAVNDNIKDDLVKLGISQDRIFILPAYLPYIEKNDDSFLPANITDFVNLHSPILSTYGWKLAINNSIDLNGFDLSIKLVGELKRNHSNIGLIICLPDPSNKSYLQYLKNEIIKNNLSHNVLFIDKALTNIHLIWKLSDVFIRATNTDGDALSVREALAHKTPVVASDVCRRPDGCIVFKNRDINSLVEKTYYVLANKLSVLKKMETLVIEDNYSSLLNIYKNMYST